MILFGLFSGRRKTCFRICPLREREVDFDFDFDFNFDFDIYVKRLRMALNLTVRFLGKNPKFYFSITYFYVSEHPSSFSHFKIDAFPKGSRNKKLFFSSRTSKGD